LGAIRAAFKWTAVDAVGLGTRHRRVGWMLVDAGGHGLEIYRSGGWVFESPRARLDRAGNEPFCPSDSRFAEDSNLVRAPMPESIGNQAA
jgi:hypothetical protein